MNNPNERVALIAGATGLVGRHCLQSLLDNPLYGKVIALTRQPFTFSHSKLECRIVDFDQLAAQTGPLSVVMLAVKLTFGKSILNIV